MWHISSLHIPKYINGSKPFVQYGYVFIAIVLFFAIVFFLSFGWKVAALKKKSFLWYYTYFYQQVSELSKSTSTEISRRRNLRTERRKKREVSLLLLECENFYIYCNFTLLLHHTTYLQMSWFWMFLINWRIKCSFIGWENSPPS